MPLCGLKEREQGAGAGEEEAEEAGTGAGLAGAMLVVVQRLLGVSLNGFQVWRVAQAIECLHRADTRPYIAAFCHA